MSELIIIGYDDHSIAEQAQTRALAMQRDLILDIAGIATVEVDPDGKKHVHTPGSVVGSGAASGALWGTIIGLFFLNPAVGMLIGGAWGAILGRLAKSGLNHEFRSRVDGLLTPGKSALILMTRKITEDKFAAGMAEFGGTILRSSLSDKDEKELAEMLGVPEDAQ